MIALRYGPLSFRDSCCLLSGRLAQPIEDKKEGNLAQTFLLMAERHPYRQVGLDLLLRKMPFPYNDMTDRSRLSPGYHSSQDSLLQRSTRGGCGRGRVGLLGGGSR